jgi:hypothetical protein
MVHWKQGRVKPTRVLDFLLSSLMMALHSNSPVERKETREGLYEFENSCRFGVEGDGAAKSWGLRAGMHRAWQRDRGL